VRKEIPTRSSAGKVVSFGMATVLRDLHVVESRAAYLVMVVVIAIDAWLRYGFLTSDRTDAPAMAGDSTQV
jgi:hypothetical protein